jgi:hypothetical protein
MNNRISQNINVSNESFYVHELLSESDIKKAEELIFSPPKGTWIKKKYDRIIIGISFFAKDALRILPFSFVLIIPFIGLIGTIIIYKNIIGALIEWSIFLIPSIIILWKIMLIFFGRAEIVFSSKPYIFSGVFIFGKKKYFNSELVKRIFEIRTVPDSFNNYKKDIYIEEEKIIEIPLNYAPDSKSNFFILMLKYYIYKKI